MNQPRHSKSNRKLDVDDGLFTIIESVSKKHANQDQTTGSPPTLESGLPLPSLALRYLLQNSCLPLGLVYHVVGPPAVFKSTLLAEIIRWHVECDGYGIICETETKPTPVLRKSILGWENNRVVVRECTSVEHWQSTIVDYVKAIKKRYSDTNQLKNPMIFGVDSYMGKMPLRLQEKFARQGYAEKHFGEAAQIIGDWLSVYTALIKGWPFTLVGINHLKKTTDLITGMPIYRTPGGQFLQHQNVIEIRVGRSKTERKLADDVPYYETVLQLQTSKNSRGAQDKRIYVILRQWNEVDDSGQTRLCSNFEWWDSSIRILYDGWGLSNSEKEILLPLIHKTIKIQKLSRGNAFWCDELGVSKNDAMSAHDLGIILESKEDILNELYKVLGVSVIPIFGEIKPVDLAVSRISGSEEIDEIDFEEPIQIDEAS